MGIQNRIAQYRAYKKGVSHCTFNPEGPGVVRIHLIPPKFRLFRSSAYIVILNGYYLLPLGYSWALLLTHFMEEVNKFHGKPITEEDVAAELENLRFPPVAPNNDRLFVRCFGNFEVFANGEPLRFERTKTKELFAYLVDRRGAVVSLREIEAVLWEQGPRDERVSGSYLRTLTADLRRTLEARGHGDVLVKRYGALGLKTSNFDCDYYDYLDGKPLAITAWQGEYMEQYSWAEPSKAALLR
jgi:hypothetical protein